MPLAPLSRRRKVNLLTVLGELVQTTAGSGSPTHQPAARTGTSSARIKSSSVTSSALDMAAAATPAGIAEPAMLWCTGRR
jgi:hypothetical protein